MNDPAPPTPDPIPSPTVEEQAVRWLVRRMDAASWSAKDEAALREWRRSDPEHEQELCEAEAALGIMSAEQPRAAMHADPIIQRTQRTVRARTLKRRALLGGTAALLLSATGLGIFWERSRWRITGVGETREWTLSDGTKIVLDAQSRLRVAYDGGQRVLHLESGRALFDVAKDHRPFSVRTAGLEVRDIGTVFDVHHLQSSMTDTPTTSGVEITVSSGLVEVRPLQEPDSPDTPEAAAWSWRVAAGEQLVWTAGVRDPVRRTADLASFGGWRGGRLIYRDRPLSQVLGDLQRYSDKKLILTDAELGRFKIRATLQSSDVMRALDILAQVAPLNVSLRDENTLLIGRKP